MADLETLKKLRSEDIETMKQEIAEVEAELAERSAAAAPSPTRSLDEQDQLDYDMYQRAHYLDDLKDDLRLLEAMPVTARDTPEDLSRSMEPGLAIVVGHSILGNDPGATGHGFPDTVQGAMRQEVHWNKELARMTKEIADQRGVRCAVFERNQARGPGVIQAYRDVRNWGCSAAIELHFNAIARAPQTKARGTETLYVTPESKAWAQRLQAGMTNLYSAADASWKNRGLKPNPPRGRLSLKGLASQNKPVVILEPFFGDNPKDASVGQARKADLAHLLVETFVHQFGVAAKPIGEVGTAPAAQKPSHFSEPFWKLREVYSGTEIDYPQLKGITYAKWALESDYGRSKLAREYLNFAGMKYRKEMAPYATPVPYTDWQGKTTDYCRFASLQEFIKAYWLRLDLVKAYAGWRDYSATPESFINFVGPIWAPVSDGNERYQDKILKLYANLRAEGLVPGASVPTVPPIAAGPSMPDASPGAIVFKDEGLTAALEKFAAEGDRVLKSPGVPEKVTAALGTTLAACTTLATTLVSAAEGEAVPAAKLRTLADATRRAESRATSLFQKIVAALDATPDLSRGAKEAIAAHWALESNWGRSELATIHYNFAGLEWDDALDDYAGMVPYKTKGMFCRFDDLDRFLAAYWKRLTTDKILERRKAAGAEEFAGLIAGLWRPAQQNYPHLIGSVAKRITAAGIEGRPTIAPPSTAPAIITTPASPTPGDTDALVDTGFVVRVRRTGTERRSYGTHRVRTVGTYETFFAGQKLGGPLMEGFMYEQNGPGDNTHSGVRNKRRIEAKTYPLYTHGFPQSKYKTFGYTSSLARGERSPPAIRVGDTGARTAILLHPGWGFLSSIGCLNFSKPQEGARAAMEWIDSRKRAIALIDALKVQLGDQFPGENGHLIPHATLLVEGEPAGTRSLLESRARSGDTAFEINRSISGSVIVGLAKSELFGLLADTIRGEVLPEVVNADLFRKILEERGYLKDSWFFSRASEKLTALRGDRGETLWEAWADGWQAAEEIPDPEERARVRMELDKIADTLERLGVDINQPGFFETPLTAAAGKGAEAAVAALIKRRASVDQHDPQGNTPLITAAFSAAGAVVRTLIRYGAKRLLQRVVPVDLGTRSLGDDMTVLDYAAELPPEAADAIAAAMAGQAVLGHPADLTGSDRERYEAYERVIAELQEAG